MSRQAMELALRALDNYMSLPAPAKKAITALREALAEQPAQPQEPVAWNVIDPFGKIVATEKDAIRGWARIQGYKPTVESLLGFQEQGWRVVPTFPPAQRTWVGLTDEEIIECERLAEIRLKKHLSSIRGQMITSADFFNFHFAQAVENKLKEKNT